ncbi:hypothetical protein ED28_11835 [[Pantoea] beijingensis]|uniref:Uncharacterized protein n=1 Tax=[Pantoea] beijingensis TaxID=1324864 RepID=A0A443IC75_9GAMM|nr:hypothetical protein [[Pantoea] beijingensis]RWR01709.1 hypothetical protein ED28_11835 [[Pantoea] beijingensis]
MSNYIKGVIIFISVFISASLLKGAGVGFESWYAAPENLSKALVTILSMCAVAKIGIFLSRLFLKKNN